MGQLPEFARVFRLNGKDLTFFKLEENSGYTQGARMMFYMRFEKLWMYPPGNKMETMFWKNLNKNGFHYAENEFNQEVQRLENWYKEQIG